MGLLLLLLLLLFSAAHVESSSQCDDDFSGNYSAKKIVIRVCAGSYSLTRKLSFNEKNEVSIIGDAHNFSTLICNGTNVGLYLNNVKRVKIHNMLFFQCGCKWTNDNEKQHYANSNTGVLIRNSSNISVVNTTISYSRGLGLVISQSNASISILNSTFSHTNGGGGVLITLIKVTAKKYKPLKLNIKNCTFRDNIAYSKRKNLGKGGGLYIFLKQWFVRVEIDNCTFYNNTAKLWGGGLNINIESLSKHINVSVVNSIFSRNNSSKGGGAANVGYIFFYDVIPCNTSIEFINDTFDNNTAVYGGGVLIYSLQSKPKDSAIIQSNMIKFEDCTWMNNKARYSAALYFNIHILGTFNTAGNLLPKPSLKNCRFIRNTVSNLIKDIDTDQLVIRGKGCVMTMGFDFSMSGSIEFINNTGTALYLMSSTIAITNDTVLKFEGNTGYNGGAISLFGTSTLDLYSNITLSFKNNNATVRGGAIYQENVNTLDYIADRNCFFHFYNPRQGMNDIHFTFVNNNCSTTNCGKSIFLSSIYPCKSLIDFQAWVQNETANNVTRYSNVTTFTFSHELKTEISSLGTNFRFLQNITTALSLIPGKITKIPVEVVNDFNISTPTVYQVSLIDITGTIRLDNKYIRIFSSNVLLNGQPNATARLSLSLKDGSQEKSFPVRLQECPPGYIHNSNSCECSIHKSTNDRYHGIVRCNSSTFQAYIKRGYWAGYINQDSGRDDDEGMERNLVTALCPKKYCYTKANIENELTNTTSIKDLNARVCGPYRRGILCAECTDNYSIFYHAGGLYCSRNQHCRWGWVLFILSELLPVTILFAFIVVFDVQLTTGPIQGFILYIQIVDTLHISAGHQIWLHIVAYRMQQYLRFIASMFNLNFFTKRELSFCLWENASALDIYAVKYVTIIYSLGLVLLAVAILNCKFFTLQKYLRKLRGTKPDVGTSIVHGLSGFLVMCYSQCTNVSLLILTPITLYHKGSVRFKTVPFYDGRLDYMEGRHLIYGLPALIFMIFIVVIPPLLLVSYPLCYRIFSLLRIEESKFSRLLCKLIPLEKFKPFFDSFQSSFKDEYRYFSGLYFFYRFIALVTFAFFHDLSHFYTIVELQFLMILAVHAWVQPYRIAWHNKLDTFIFATLAVINSMTLYNYNLVSSNHQGQFDHIVDTVGIIQAVICYLPLLYMLVYLTGRISVSVKRCCCRKSNVDNNLLSLSLLEYDHRSEYNKQE